MLLTRSAGSPRIAYRVHGAGPDHHAAADVARHHHLLAIPPVDEDASDRGHQEAGQHARNHDDRDRDLGWSFGQAIDLGLKVHSAGRRKRGPSRFQGGGQRFFQVAIEQNKPELAARTLVTAIAIDPRDPNMPDSLAQLYFQMGKKQEATDACEAALKINPGNLRVRERLIAALVETQADPAYIETHRKYLAYYQAGAAKNQQPKLQPPPVPPTGPPAVPPKR